MIYAIVPLLLAACAIGHALWLLINMLRQAKQLRKRQHELTQLRLQDGDFIFTFAPCGLGKVCVQVLGPAINKPLGRPLLVEHAEKLTLVEAAIRFARTQTSHTLSS
ncbi:hypothetical protein [Gloeobacter kilaueensis]|uniref:Uncharacterized protein n=1 Tax=Gloeobacter kilaueensis (strain ATCC BAA-2537 / CCAP 1431/1 / ULC 316 / JS1) TaxID=1183438 RepID=U5QGD0_GLOK1|nr:hypothetical protein [Gloeobacter kilaueensis]AGY57976.1 hypothetical protein GKIL_1730 [Gloeobacter kilaueensis JS1]